MSADVGVVIASSASSGMFALLGVAVSNRTAVHRDARAFRTETALELPGVKRLVWGDDWIELQAYLQRQQARVALAAFGLPQPEMNPPRRSTWVYPWRGSAGRGELKVHWRQLSAVPTAAEKWRRAALCDPAFPLPDSRSVAYLEPVRK